MQKIDDGTTSGKGQSIDEVGSLDLSCEASDVVANERTKSASSFFFQHNDHATCQSCPTIKMTSRRALSLVLRSVYPPSIGITQLTPTEHGTPPPPHRHLQTRPTCLPDFGPLLQHLLPPSPRFNRRLPSLLLDLYSPHRLFSPYPSPVRLSRISTMGHCKLGARAG